MSKLKELAFEKDILIVQDLDGVCIQLVKDPLKRIIDKDYVLNALKAKSDFAVLTNGEHEGERGVNRLIEKSLGKARGETSYLPGLAAGGVEYQNQDGEISYPGVSEEEITFLKVLPEIMKNRLIDNLKEMKDEIGSINYDKEAEFAVLRNRFSPTINLNSIFEIVKEDIPLIRRIQLMLEKMMEEMLIIASQKGLHGSFYLHIAPNLGINNGKEKLKLATKDNIGTTDIQFMLTGARKEAGLLVLLNKYIEKKKGVSPFGERFNVREAPESSIDLRAMCLEHIARKDMPLIIGVGDTVTSVKDINSGEYCRGGSDRGFLTLIQELGEDYKKNNQILIVDSSWGEVERPRLSGQTLIGVSDSEDPLKFNLIFRKGPEEYIKWFQDLINLRYKSII